MDEQGDQPEQGRAEQSEGGEAAEGANPNRLIVAYAIASTVVLAIAVLVFVLASDGGESAAREGSAHINLNAAIGSTNGIEPDSRAGTEPAPVKDADLVVAARKAGCDLRLKLKDEGNEHIPLASPTPDYKTSPPTSGAHVDPPYQQADGAYREMPAEIAFVHSLEHGRLEVQYSPDLPEADQLALKGVYDTMYGATLLFPNDAMPYAVAATTWTNLLGCPTYEGAATLDAIRDFGRATWGKYGGEPARAFTFTGPTPARPAQ